MKVIVALIIIRTIPAMVFGAMDSFMIIRARRGARAGLIKNTMEAVAADVFSIAKK